MVFGALVLVYGDLGFILCDDGFSIWMTCPRMPTHLAGSLPGYSGIIRAYRAFDVCGTTRVCDITIRPLCGARDTRIRLTAHVFVLLFYGITADGVIINDTPCSSMHNKYEP